MTAFTLPVLVGQEHNTGSDRTLHLKVWSGEIITQFDRATIMKALMTTRRITTGKSATFPVLGRASAAFHIPGENILTSGTLGDDYLSNIETSERVILVDNLLISSLILNDLDSAMNHYDERAPLTAELGNALAAQFDIHAMAKLYATASEASTLTVVTSDDPAGSTLTVGANNTEPTGVQWLAMFWAAAEAMDLNFVPADSRYFIVPPQNYYSLFNNDQLQKFIDRDVGGMGSNALAKFPKIANFSIISTALFPITNLAQATGDLNDYGTDMSLAMGVFGHSSAIGTVQLLDVGVQAEYKLELQGDLVVARYASGTGTLRPGSAIAVKADTVRWF